MNVFTLNKTIKIIKIIIWFIPLILFIWIINQYFVFSGKLQIKYNVEKDSKFIKNFASKEKEKIIGTKNKVGNKDYFQVITTSPVYFDVKVPRPFQKATVTLAYQNPDSQPVIKLGVKQANGAYFYKDMAFMNSILENLPVYWDKIQEDNLVLWQKNSMYKQEIEKKQQEFLEKKNEIDKWRDQSLSELDNKYLFDNEELDEDIMNELETEKQSVNKEYQENLDRITKENKAKKSKSEFASINNFLNNLPDKNKILQYNYDLSSYLEMPYYQKSYQTIEINNSLRGKHVIYTYIGKDEGLNFVFTVQDINRNLGEDVFKVSVFNNKGERVKEEIILDDGEKNATGKISIERTLQILIENIPHGIYRLVINTPDDIFIKKIITFQHKIMFKKNIYLVDNEEYKEILGNKKLEPTTLYTNSKSINAKTAHEEGLQKLEITTDYKKNYLEINDRHMPKEFTGLTGVTKIFSPKNDIYIEGNGFFAFSEDELFEPNFISVTNLNSKTNVEDYNYIIASYPQAKQEGEWLVASAEVSAPYLYFSKNKSNQTIASFIFSLPGLPENNRILKIKEVNIIFEKEPVTINNFFTKLKDWLSRNIKMLKK